MNGYALLPLFSTVVFIWTGLFVYFLNKNSLLNKLYLAFATSWGVQAFIIFGYRQSQSYDQACFWWSVDFFWPSNVVTLIYFTLVFVEKGHLLKKRITHLVTLGPAVAFSVTEMQTDLITGPPVKQDWGWYYGAFQDGIIGNLAGVWVLSSWIAVVISSTGYYLKTSDPGKRKRARPIALAMLLGLAGAVLDNLQSLTSHGVQLPPLWGPFLVTFNIIIAHAIWRYELFSLSPTTVVEHIVTAMADTLLLVYPNRTIASGNKAALDFFGRTEKDLVKVPLTSLFAIGANVPAWISSDGGETDTAVKHLETKLVDRNGEAIPVSIASSALLDGNGFVMGYLMLARDITERQAKDEELEQYRYHLEELVEKRTLELVESREKLNRETRQRKEVERERSILEEQLQHAQKIEAIGRLAGGVAHEFNNLLFVINGYTEHLMANLDSRDPRRASVEEVIRASENASNIVQQLLAFSRKQVVTPRVIDPGEMIANSRNMLERLLGENIELRFVRGVDTGRVNIDPGQLGQVIINLAVNARDAMPTGGKLEIDFEKISLRESDPMINPEEDPGSYVVITVKDTGCGIDSDTSKRIFEPFFTTKGSGTGLGLSTVYAIARQNRGFVRVVSDPGKGASFKVFLPEYDHAAREVDRVSYPEPKEGNETILLVEDEEQVRRLACRFLKSLGYNVLEASNAAEAMAIFNELDGEIDLLFTDLIMPGMSASQLSDRLLSSNPRLKVLCMSGYGDDIFDQFAPPAICKALIQKPFTPGDLSHKIRELLDG